MGFENITDIEMEARQDDVENFVIESIENTFRLMKPVASIYFYEDEISMYIDNPFNERLLLKQRVNHVDYVNNDLKDWHKHQQLEIIASRTAALKKLIDLYQAKKDELLQ